MGVGILFLFIIIVVSFRLIAGSFDGDRIEQEIKARGGKLISKEWSPFG